MLKRKWKNIEVFKKMQNKRFTNKLTNRSKTIKFKIDIASKIVLCGLNSFVLFGDQKEWEGSNIRAVEMIKRSTRSFDKSWAHKIKEVLNKIFALLQTKKNNAFCTHFIAFTNYIYNIQKDFKGLTGKIRFDQEGFRTDIELELVDLTENGLRVTGTWSTKTGLNISRSSDSEIRPSGKEFDLRNMTFVVITALVSSSCPRWSTHMF